MDTSDRVENQYNRVSEKCPVREKESDPVRILEPVCNESSGIAMGRGCADSFTGNHSSLSRLSRLLYYTTARLAA
jgi:hypothetical protein